MASALADDGDIELTCSIAPGLQVLAPTGMVARIVDELLGNAMMYARSRVTVELLLRDGQAELRVSDDGPGLPAHEREAIFQRFQRGSTAVPGGSGLGLALVRESVAGVGGRAWAEESPLGGLTVVAQMPVAPVVQLARDQSD
jgi:signal transduction histidine kinase